MNARPGGTPFRPTGFRLRLLVTLMLVVSALTIAGIVWTERNLAAAAERELQRSFSAELATLHHLQDLRQAALLERSRLLVRRARIQAAFEDDALDLLYPSAKDELRDIKQTAVLEEGAPPAAYSLRADFYRFLDRAGALVPVPAPPEAGTLRPSEETELRLPRAPETPQIGYLARLLPDGHETVAEVIAMPIVSLETGAPLAALVLGFGAASAAPASDTDELGIKRGLWIDGRLHMPALDRSSSDLIAEYLASAIAQPAPEGGRRHEFHGHAHQLFYKQLNPGSLYPPAYEVCLYPLADLLSRQHRARWQLIGAVAVLLVGGLAASHFLSDRLSRPVEKMAVDSFENRRQRERAEAALESTHAELERAARFSADASHQLKTPVAVLRAGLEELRAQPGWSVEAADEISSLIHQTDRLSGVIDDLLLLSRMDAGRLELKQSPVNLSRLLEAALDDLGAQPSAATLSLDTEVPDDLLVLGDEHYLSLILQNLLENAWKYNRPDGRIRVVARRLGHSSFLRVGNTGRTISPAAQQHIFERFHRGSIGENVPGYGLGLNLARELARLHRGDLQLLRSAEDWTEFEVRLPAPTESVPSNAPA